MSKFSKMIRERITNERKIDYRFIPFTFDAIPSTSTCSYKTVFKVGVQLEAKCAIDTSDPCASEKLAREKTRISQMLVEFVFGEFREDIHHIRHCIAVSDMDEAMRILVAMYKKKKKKCLISRSKPCTPPRISVP